MDIYINPNLKIYENFEDVKKDTTMQGFDWWSNEEKLYIKDLFSHNRLIVLSEPGFGKTELFNKIVEVSENKEFLSIMIDLKKLDFSKSISRNIIDRIERPDIKKTSDFKLTNEEKVIVCLDAFDEVTTNNISLLEEKVKEFITEYDLIKVFISSRTLYYSKHDTEFSNYNFKFISIECFSHQQMLDYLDKNGINEDNADLILKNFQQVGKISVIQTPRYLNLLVKYIKENGIGNLEEITASQLFEHFIYYKLEKEKDVLENLDPELFKRNLETLALTMEIYQTNKLSKDELLTFFNDIKNDLKMNILNQISIDKFLSRSILKDNINEIEFDNTEFQEYLAAKEISRFNKLNQSVFDLSINPELREMYPSWFNVIRYLIEMKIGLINEILDFGMKGEKTIVEGYFELITNTNVTLLDNDIRTKIFKNVFEYYQNNTLMLRNKLFQNLSYYYTIDSMDLLKNYIEQDYDDSEHHRILMQNVLHMIYELMERKYLKADEIQYWLEKFIELLKGDNVNIGLKREIIYLTRHFKDIRILEIIHKIKHEFDKASLNSIIVSASYIDVNNDITLELVIDGINEETSISLDSIFNMSSIDILKKLFKRLINDEGLLDKFHHICSEISYEKHLEKFLENISKIADEELTLLIKDFIIASYINHSAWADYSKVLPRLIELISLLRKDILFEFIDAFSKTESIYHHLLPSVFDKCLYLDQVNDFVKTIKEKFIKYEWIAFHTLYRMKDSNRENAEEIYEKGRQYYEEEYKKAESQKVETQPDDEKLTRSQYLDFKEKLKHSGEKRFLLDIFYIYAQNYKLMEDYIKDEEKNKLKRLTIHFLKTYNPYKSGLEIIETKKNGSRQYRTNVNNNYYGYAIQCAEILEIDIREFRQNIINYIPFAFSEPLQSIFNLIDSVSTEEAKPIIEIFEKKVDDLWKFSPENFLQLVERNNLLEAERIVEEIFKIPNLKNEKHGIPYYRIKALEILDAFKNDKGYLKEIFNEYLPKDQEQLIAIVANKILITKYQNEDAIKWRLDQIVSRAFEHTYVLDAHWVDPNEDELNSKSFATPLMKINNDIYKDMYLNILDKSFEIQSKGDGYQNYAHYMREIVLSYFANLKTYKKLEYLKELEIRIKHFKNESGYSLLIERLHGLKNLYLNYLGKPQNISECIKTYNETKNKQYIDISNSRDLLDLLIDLIKNNLNNWIKEEGSKILDGFKEKSRASEKELQRLLKMQFNIVLLEKGFRPNEIYIYREAQLLDDKRSDFLIGYGFVDPILIELKLSDHADINKEDLKDTESYKNFQHYIRNFGVDYSIFLVYENLKRSDKEWEEQIKKINSIYGEIENVNVIGIPIVN